MASATAVSSRLIGLGAFGHHSIKNCATFDSTPGMERIVRAPLAELTLPSALSSLTGTLSSTGESYLNRIAKLAPTVLELSSNKNNLPDGSPRSIVYISRAILDNERSQTRMDL